jgi:hypothetical protein
MNTECRYEPIRSDLVRSYVCGFEILLGRGSIAGLFARLEGQWFGELNRHPA